MNWLRSAATRPDHPCRKKNGVRPYFSLPDQITSAIKKIGSDPIFPIFLQILAQKLRKRHRFASYDLLKDVVDLAGGRAIRDL